MEPRLVRVRRFLLGESPRLLLWLTLPTLGALALDLVLRAGALAGYALQGKAIYGSSLLISAAFWALPIWGVARVLVRTREGAPGGEGPVTSARGTTAPRRGRGPRRPAARSWGARGAAAAIGTLWLLPLVTFGFGGQALYFRVFHAYMGRDTLRLGIALRGTVRDWFSAWGGPWLMAAMAIGGIGIVAGMMWLARRVEASGKGPVPWLLVGTFVASLVCFWTDSVDSRFLQAATPDACFVHGVVHAARMAITGQWGRRQGVSIRTPAPLPPLVSARDPKLDVILVITESVRADATCSDPPPGCRSEFLDPVAADRVALGKLTAQTPNTFSASVILWSGVKTNADFHAAHTAPVLWELARKLGYRTGYLSAQNPDYEDFGVFTRNAGIDVLVTANDLGGMGQEQLGAPDERATGAALDFVKSVPEGTPYFAVVHLSNTHMPYRIDPELVPFQPQSPDPLGNVAAFHNRYRDAVRLQERTVAAMLAALKQLPRWDRTVVVFVSDHGEQFREHGGLYHNHSLFDEEVRTPGWLVAGASALSDDEKKALASYAGRRTYTQDVHETIVDLLGLEPARASLPLAELVTGRSLLRPYAGEPTALLATSTSVWEPDDARYGVMKGDRMLFGGPNGHWACFDLAHDPGEHSMRSPDWCPELLATARSEFGGVAKVW